MNKRRERECGGKKGAEIEKDGGRREGGRKGRKEREKKGWKILYK